MQASVTAPPAEKTSKLMPAMATLAIAGVLVSSFSLYHHFSKSKTSFCDLGQSFSCDLVNRSQYSTVLGVPVALIGILGYLLLLALATVYRSKAETPFMLAIASFFGLGFALYLTYIEAVVLGAWCILCLTSLALISSISVLAALNLRLALKAKA
jgi:vitamin-K-epoxide reductase (warfarin-sensitive)